MMLPTTEDFLRVGVAIALGALLGLEREYRSKAAGFRTLTLISLGACLFTLVSRYVGGMTSPDRIASNVVQGIGFLGAGVIFKENGSISGLTTATAIWVASAIGMTAGTGNFLLASVTTGGALIVLAGFEQIQFIVDRLHQYRDYRITYAKNAFDVHELEVAFARHRIRFRKTRESRDRDEITCWYALRGKSTFFEDLDRHLVNDARILAFGN
jgi:putative Mg2+ transporter-C (MgtC) family protein